MPKLPAWRSTTFSLPATLRGARLRVIRCGAPPSPEGSIGRGPGSLEGSSLRVGSRSDAPASRTQGPPWTHHRPRARTGETWTTLISKNTKTVTQSKSKVAASFKIQYNVSVKLFTKGLYSINIFYKLAYYQEPVIKRSLLENQLCDDNIASQLL